MGTNFSSGAAITNDLALNPAISSRLDASTSHLIASLVKATSKHSFTNQTIGFHFFNPRSISGISLLVTASQTTSAAPRALALSIREVKISLSG